MKKLIFLYFILSSLVHAHMPKLDVLGIAINDVSSIVLENGREIDLSSINNLNLFILANRGDEPELFKMKAEAKTAQKVLLNELAQIKVLSVAL